MKKKVTKEMEVEVTLCNICHGELEKEPFDRARIEIVRCLFKTQDFHVHEKCMNTVIKETFDKYILPVSKKKKR